MKHISSKIFLLLCVNSLISSQNSINIFDKFESSFISINDYKINVEILGEGQPIVFLAGGPGNSHDYMQENFGKYYKTNKVIFIDFLGRGLSDNAKDKSEYSITNDVELLESIRKKLNLEIISIVGHSYGAVHAQAYTLKYPEFVDKLVLINGFHSGEMWQANCDSYNHYAKTHFPELWAKVDSLRNLGYVSSDPEFMKIYGSFPIKYVYYHNTNIQQKLPAVDIRGMNMDVYFAILGRDADFFVGGTMINIDFRRNLKDIKAETMIIAGRYDGVSTPKYAVQYKRFMPQAKFVMFENSGHNPYLEEPEKFFRLFEEFFEINFTE
jgi:proline iminopeptidase